MAASYRPAAFDNLTSYSILRSRAQWARVFEVEATCWKPWMLVDKYKVVLIEVSSNVKLTRASVGHVSLKYLPFSIYIV